jgi:hypothetical protein
MFHELSLPTPAHSWRLSFVPVAVIARYHWNVNDFKRCNSEAESKWLQACFDVLNAAAPWPQSVVQGSVITAWRMLQCQGGLLTFGKTLYESRNTLITRVTFVTQQFRHLHLQLLQFMEIRTRSDVTVRWLLCSLGGNSPVTELSPCVCLFMGARVLTVFVTASRQRQFPIDSFLK